MPAIVQISGGFGLRVEPGGIMGLGFEVTPTALYAGTNGSGNSRTSSKYFFNTDVAIAGALWETFTHTRLQRVHDSTAFDAYIRYSQNSRRYTYADDTTSSQGGSGVNLGGQGWGFNSPTTAYYSSDQSMAKRVYATGTETTSIATTTNEHNQGTGAASGTTGVVGGGGSPIRKFVQQFNMNTETLIPENAPGSNLTYSDAGQNAMACAANFAGQVYFWGGSIGSGNTQEEASVHTISTNTSASATSLSTGRRYAGAASNGFDAIVAGGVVDGGVPTTDAVRVNMTNDTHTSATALDLARDPGYGTSNVHPTAA